MPFRDPTAPGAEALDPLARFFALEAAFDQGRGVLGDHVPLRLVAANLVLAEGEPEVIAAEVRGMTEDLIDRLGRFSPFRGSMALLIAAILRERGDTPEALVAELERVRPLLREAKVRRNQVFEGIAVLALRIRGGLAPVDAALVERMQAIYSAMKTHHWMLTGPEDLPACAFLATTELSPELAGARAHAIYEGLRARPRTWGGDPLQTASNLLTLSPLEPDELVERFVILAETFHAQGMRIRQHHYDEVALLCFLARPAAKIVETVLGYAEAIRAELRWVDGNMGFGLATNLAYVRLVGGDAQLGVLADAKTLLDMQTIIAARQAAAAAAAAGAAG